MAVERSALEKLSSLVDEHEQSASDWRASLPALRAQASATAAVLSELAQVPSDESSSSEYVDVLLAAPDRAWADDVIARLRHDLPAAKVMMYSEQAPDTSPAGYTIRAQVSIPGVERSAASQRVRSTLMGMSDLAVDYSEPIELVVVAPRA
ncbi:MAG: hypothetical protein ACHQHO_12025 [Solirubrobacterales bacterium]